MNTNALVGLVAAVIILGGGAYMYVSYSNPVTPDGMGASVLDSLEHSDMRFRGDNTFASVMEQEEDMRCDFTHDHEGQVTTGRVYLTIDGERIRGDFTVTDETNKEGHIIRDDGYNYVWGSLYAEGMKVAVTEENRSALFESKDVSIPDNIAYNCEPWEVDKDVFILPTDIIFEDFNG